MENKNGSGIFLGVVGVATLVVAIVGATFAWFSASAGSLDVSAQAYQFATSSQTLKVDTNSEATVQGLIPMNAADVETAVTKESKKCVDSKGYDACEIWSVTFTNNAAAPVTLSATATVTTNSFEEDHLKLTAGHETLEEVTATGAVGLGAATTTDTLNTVSIDAAVLDEDGTVTTAGTKTMYYVVYLEEMGNDNNADQGDKMTGTITFQDQSGNQLTANFGA